MIYRELGHLEEALAALNQVVELDQLVQNPDLESDTAMLAQVEAELTAKKSSWVKRIFANISFRRH